MVQKMADVCIRIARYVIVYCQNDATESGRKAAEKVLIKMRVD